MEQYKSLWISGRALNHLDVWTGVVRTRETFTRSRRAWTHEGGKTVRTTKETFRIEEAAKAHRLKLARNWLDWAEETRSR
jgi:hypothetical protein